MEGAASSRQHLFGTVAPRETLPNTAWLDRASCWRPARWSRETDSVHTRRAHVGAQLTNPRR